MLEFAGLKVLTLGGYLTGALVLDLRQRRIPNSLCAVAIVTGLALQFVAAGADGLVAGIGGLLTGFALLLPLYCVGGMGAGDVKLMASVGTYLGPTGALVASVATLIVGAVIAGFVVMWNQVQGRRIPKHASALRSLEPHTLSQLEFPYAVAIALGTTIALASDLSLSLGL
jgi:prepilin peptidase CpaA